MNGRDLPYFGESQSRFGFGQQECGNDSEGA